MKIYEFVDEDYNKVVDIAEEIKTLATHLLKCFDKVEEKGNSLNGEINLRRRGPSMGGGRGSYNMPRMRGGQGSYPEVQPPHMRGYIVRPEDEDWMYNERYNWLS